jgi:PAS domain S-box-containing protein
VELAPQLGGQSTFGLFGPGLEPLRVAENFERLFGRLERSYYGTPSSFFEAIHPDDRPAVRALLGGRLEAPAEIEVRVQHATSGLRWVWLHASAATSESGAPTVAWWAYDITAQKRAELALERSERAYRELTEEASDGIAIGDAQGYMLYANQAACEILGRSREQLIGVHFTTWFAPGELEKNPVDWDRANRGEVVRNERHITRGDGGLIVVESVTKRLPDGHFESIIRDVTERRRAQDALRLSEERYRLISELTSDFASSVLVDPDGTLRREWITDAFERITGFSPDEVDARGRILCLSEDELRARGTPYLLHPEDGPELERRRRALLAGPWTASQDEFRIVTRSGEVRWIRQTSRRLPSAIGPGVRIYCAAQDITAHKAVEDQRRRYSEHLEAEVRRRTAELEKLNEELRELQQELLAAQRLGVAEDLAGKVAHSINNPLAALIGTAEIALANRRRRDPHIEQILKLGRRIRTVVARTLQLYREGGLVLRGEDPGEILRDVAEELEVRAKPFDVKVSVSVAADLPVLHADRRLLASALASIGENAIEAMPLGGELSLDVRKLDELEVVEFRIADRGPGIPEALREKIFEPFFTTKGSGAGLGLAIARGIIAGHEGHVRVEAREEGGTRVVVALPRYPASDSLASS